MMALGDPNFLKAAPMKIRILTAAEIEQLSKYGDFAQAASPEGMRIDPPRMGPRRVSDDDLAKWLARRNGLPSFEFQGSLAHAPRGSGLPADMQAELREGASRAVLRELDGWTEKVKMTVQGALCGETAVLFFHSEGQAKIFGMDASSPELISRRAIPSEPLLALSLADPSALFAVQEAEQLAAAAKPGSGSAPGPRV